MIKIPKFRKRRGGKMSPGDVLYNAIMSVIEPDLMTMNASALDEKYMGETQEEREKRMERYKKAFEAFDKVADGINDELVREAKEKKASLNRSVRRKEKKEKQEEIEEVQKKIESINEFSS